VGASPQAPVRREPLLGRRYPASVMPFRLRRHVQTIRPPRRNAYSSTCGLPQPRESGSWRRISDAGAPGAASPVRRTTRPGARTPRSGGPAGPSAGCALPVPAQPAAAARRSQSRRP
jgi:hypothetical protein